MGRSLWVCGQEGPGAWPSTRTCAEPGSGVGSLEGLLRLPCPPHQQPLVRLCPCYPRAQPIWVITRGCSSFQRASLESDNLMVTHPEADLPRAAGQASSLLWKTLGFRGAPGGSHCPPWHPLRPHLQLRGIFALRVTSVMQALLLGYRQYPFTLRCSCPLQLCSRWSPGRIALTTGMAKPLTPPGLLFSLPDPVPGAGGGASSSQDVCVCPCASTGHRSPLC